ncbi:TPA: hypothetical protein ACQYC6_004098 [Vibrio parahaemolyticus]
MNTTHITQLGLLFLATSCNVSASTTVCINDNHFHYSGNNARVITINTETKDIAVKAEIQGDIYTHNYKVTKVSELSNDGQYVTFYGHNGKSEYVTLVKDPKGSTLIFASISKKDGLELLKSVRRFEGLRCY